MRNHRLVASTSFLPVSVRPPFSNFDFVEKEFDAEPAIRRLFSQGRSRGARSLVVEDIPATGIVEDENEEIQRLHPGHRMEALRRLTFWARDVSSERSLRGLSGDHLIGYALLKQDSVPSTKVKRWHVFDSVFRKCNHSHNCVHSERDFTLRAGPEVFRTRGVLYCQQNGMNKACAQVALRSLCALHVPEFDLPYSRINALANVVKPGFDPSEGLEPPQIRAVLKGLGVGFDDVDYTTLRADARDKLLYQKFLYAGVESGAGALPGKTRRFVTKWDSCCPTWSGWWRCRFPSFSRRTFGSSGRLCWMPPALLRATSISAAIA